MELISPEGLRLDGRRPRELRQVKLEVGVCGTADGSATVSMGNTRVMAAVYGPREAPRSQTHHEQAVVSCDVSTAAFSGAHQHRRKAAELGQRIARTLEHALLRTLLAKTHIRIHITVLHADGGVAAAAINAATIAVIDAGIPIKDIICACTAGVVDGVTVLDMNHTETIARGPELTLAFMPKMEKIVLCHLESRVHVDHLKDLVALATQGCQALSEKVKTTIRMHTIDRLPGLGPRT